MWPAMDSSHDSKAREGKTSESSNLSATASLTRRDAGAPLGVAPALRPLVSVLVSVGPSNPLLGSCRRRDTGICARS
jgi:hypothetical protein